MEDLIEALYLPSGPETKPDEGACTPGSGPLIDTGVIGQGAFVIVSCSWDVTTGHEYACKRPVRRTFDLQRWKSEADILRSVKHVSQPKPLVCPLILGTDYSPGACRATSKLPTRSFPGLDPRIPPGRDSPHAVPGDALHDARVLDNSSSIDFGSCLPPRARTANCASRHQARQHPCSIPWPRAMIYMSSSRTPASRGRVTI